MGRKSRPRIAVLGAGAAGLSAAYSSQFRGADVDVFEARDEVGGVLRSARIAPTDESSWAYDVGAASMTLKYQPVANLVDSLDIEPIARSKELRATYVVHNGETVPLPRSPPQLLTTPLLSFKTKLRFLTEPFVSPIEDDDRARAETVFKFFKRRFSEEFVSRVVDPAVAGIYGASPKTLRMKYALPSVWNVERDNGSVIIPMIRRMFGSDADSKRLRESITFPNGMQTLPRAMADSLGDGSRLFTNSPVWRLQRRNDGTWRVNRRWDKYDAVICAVPAYSLPDIQTNLSTVEHFFTCLASSVGYAPMAVTVLGYKRKAISHALDGVGVLVPGAESRKGLLGVQFSSEGFPGKTRSNGEQDMVFLTVYTGGSRAPKFIQQPIEAIENGAVSEVNRLLGVNEPPSVTKVHVWKNAIPQPGGKQGRVVRAVRRLERAAPGLLIAGNYVDGVGVPDALRSGINATKRALRYIETLDNIGEMAANKLKPVDEQVEIVH